MMPVLRRRVNHTLSSPCSRRYHRSTSVAPLRRARNTPGSRAQRCELPSAWARPGDRRGDLLWFLNSSGALLPLTREAAIEHSQAELARRLGPRFDAAWWQPQLELTMLGQLLRSGWWLLSTLTAQDAPPTLQHEARATLDWLCDHACHRELVPSELPADTFGPLEVENYLTLLARALGLPQHTDRYKRFAHLGEPKQIMAELGPRIAELGLSPERAERFITAQFGAAVRSRVP